MMTSAASPERCSRWPTRTSCSTVRADSPSWWVIGVDEEEKEIAPAAIVTRVL
jgi:hypothetical protein